MRLEIKQVEGSTRTVYCSISRGYSGVFEERETGRRPTRVDLMNFGNYQRASRFGREVVRRGRRHGGGKRVLEVFR